MTHPTRIASSAAPLATNRTAAVRLCCIFAFGTDVKKSFPSCSLDMLDFAACLTSVLEGSVDLTLAPSGPSLELPRGLALVDMHHGEPLSSGVVRLSPEYTLVGTKDLCQQKLAQRSMEKDRFLVCQTVDCLQGFAGEAALVTLSMLEGVDGEIEEDFR